MRSKMTENLNTKSENGGVTAQSLSIPQVEPIFSFKTSGGDIYVYVVKTEIAKIAIMTFDDTSTEYVYSAITLTSSWESEHLVFNAENNFPFDEDNPFVELHKNESAMQELAELLANVFYSGE
jgi:hypothetical protein